MDDDEAVNQLTPRHFAVILILSKLAEVRKRIDENDTDREPGDYFRSQIDVWLRRTREQLQDAIEFLESKDD